MDYIFLVNVEFMLCPTEAMVFGMSAFPNWVVGSPSYRTFLSVALFFVALPVTWLYVVVVRGARTVLSKKGHHAAAPIDETSTNGVGRLSEKPSKKTK
jgi:hypothetical protein